MNLKVAISAFLAIISLSACSVVKKPSTQSTTLLYAYTDGDLSYKSQFRFKYLFFEAQRLKAIEEFEDASNIMEQCIALDPFNADAHYELAQLYIRTERLEDALFHAEQAEELNSKNIWVYNLLIQLHQALGNLQGELEAYKSLVNIDPANLEYQYYLAEMYSRIGEYKKSLKVYNEIEEVSGVSENLSIQKEHVYITLGDVDLAAYELQKLIDAFPLIIQYRGMLAELYQANDLIEEAIECYKEILKIDPSDPRANIALAEHYRLQEEFLKAFEYLDFSFVDPNFDVDVKFQILITYFQLALDDDKYLEYLYSLLDKAIESHPNHANFHALLGDVYFQKNESKLAFDAYEKSLKLGATEFLIWNRHLVLGLELQQYASVSEMGLKSIELHPSQPTLYLFTGFALSILQEEERAITVLKKGLNYVVNNRLLKAEFYSYLGDAYNTIEKHDLSDQNYEKSLAVMPENIVVLNNYSYYLSLRSKDLEKAERLSKKCLDLDPEEATYQDTYGWILFKLGRYQEAETWINKAIQNSDLARPEILEHYGDVLFKLNKIEKAVEFWNKAIEGGGDSSKLIQKASQGTLDE